MSTSILHLFFFTCFLLFKMHYLDHILECPIGPSLKVVQLRRLFDWTNMAAALPQFFGAARHPCFEVSVQNPDRSLIMHDFDLTDDFSLKIELHMLRPITEKVHSGNGRVSLVRTPIECAVSLAIYDNHGFDPVFPLRIISLGQFDKI